MSVNTRTPPPNPRCDVACACWRRFTWTLTHPTPPDPTQQHMRVFKNVHDYWRGFPPLASTCWRTIAASRHATNSVRSSGACSTLLLLHGKIVAIWRKLTCTSEEKVTCTREGKLTCTSEWSPCMMISDNRALHDDSSHFFLSLEGGGWGGWWRWMSDDYLLAYRAYSDPMRAAKISSGCCPAPSPFALT